MKIQRLILVVLLLSVTFLTNAYSQSCYNGSINGIYHTSCFPWVSSDGTVLSGGKHNDTPRLQRAIDASISKLIFDEAAYFINDYLVVSKYRTLIGTGRAVITDPNDSAYPSSRIIQTQNDKGVFKIGGGIQDVAIRDIALATYLGTGANNTIGIFAENGSTADTSLQSYDFEFSNVTIDGFNKGIFVNAVAYTPPPDAQPGEGDAGYWRFDNVKLDHVLITNCKIGVHINSKNSGWSMKNVFFNVPAGSNLPSDGVINSTNIGSLTLALYLERIGYSTIDELIADGPKFGPTASAFIYIGQHANLNIQSSIDEAFKNSIYIHGGDVNSPINLSNNFFQSPLTVKNSTVISTANQFHFPASPAIPPATAYNASRIYSFGDKFCNETSSTNCTEATYQTDYTSQVIFGANQYRNTVSALRFTTNYLPTISGNVHYDIARNANNGILEFIGNQQSGYAGYSFSTPNGTVRINNDGSVTYGSRTYSEMISGIYLNPEYAYVPPNGTVVYCSDCQKSTPCNSSGNGAIAKRINGSWDCD